MRTRKSTASGQKAPGQGIPSRREGLRLVRVWIPDIDQRSFRAEAHRQSLAVATSADEKENQDFIDAISGTE
jgi:hypothetical protein